MTNVDTNMDTVQVPQQISPKKKLMKHNTNQNGVAKNTDKLEMPAAEFPGSIPRE